VLRDKKTYNEIIIKNNGINKKQNTEKDIIIVPSFIDIIPKDFNMNNFKKENKTEEKRNDDKILSNDVNNNSNDKKLKSISHVSELSTIYNKNDEGIIPVPQIVQNNKNKNENNIIDFNELVEDETIINNKGGNTNNNINFDELSEIETNIQKNKEIVNNNDINNNQNGNQENNTDIFNFDELIESISNIKKKDAYEKKEKSIISVPHLSKIVKKDYNLNSNN
jgi:hypothetical protein